MASRTVPTTNFAPYFLADGWFEQQYDAAKLDEINRVSTIDVLWAIYRHFETFEQTLYRIISRPVIRSIQIKIADAKVY